MRGAWALAGRSRIPGETRRSAPGSASLATSVGSPSSRCQPARARSWLAHAHVIGSGMGSKMANAAGVWLSVVMIRSADVSTTLSECRSRYDMTPLEPVLGGLSWLRLVRSGTAADARGSPDPAFTGGCTRSDAPGQRLPRDGCRGAHHGERHRPREPSGGGPSGKIAQEHSSTVPGPPGRGRARGRSCSLAASPTWLELLATLVRSAAPPSWGSAPVMITGRPAHAAPRLIAEVSAHHWGTVCSTRRPMVTRADGTLGAVRSVR
jgi:hypothetical protein